MNFHRSPTGDCSRLGYVPTYRHAETLCDPATPAAAVKCYGNFGSGDKVQQAFDNRIGVSDAGQVALPGSLILNRGAKADNLAPALNPAQIASFTPLVVVVVVAIVGGVLLFNLFRK